MSAAKSKRVLSMIIAAVFAVTGFALFGGVNGKVFADSYYKTGSRIPYKVEMEYFKKAPEAWMNEEMIADSTDCTIDMASVKSSKSKVAVLISETDKNGRIYYSVKAKKAGKTTLTMKVQLAGKQEYVKKTIKVTVKKYAPAVKTLKIGKTNFSKRLKSTFFIEQKKDVSGKLVVKAKNGWKIKSIELMDNNLNTKKVKNNQKIRMTDGDSLTVYFKKGKNFKFVTIWNM